MSITLRWFGHGTWGIKTGKYHIVLDPFFNDNPSSPVKADEVDADFILVSHGHFDHIADAASIANRCKAAVICVFEIAQWLTDKQGVKNTVGMNLGGQLIFPFGTVKLTLAFHSSTLPDGSAGGNPAGFLLTIDNKKLYFACDTALFGDMKLIGEEDLDLAVLPIGDMFTMGLADSLKAIGWLRPKHVAPAHYDTWPSIHQNIPVWEDRVRKETKAQPIVLRPGETFELT